LKIVETMKTIAHVLSLIFLTLFFSREEEHVEVTAQPGEGVYALMREFQLSAYSCNFEKFYELNGLQKNAKLIQGKKYLLPIQKRAYNSKSIRTSLGISDYQLALQIQYYNEAMYEAGLREKPFQSDKVLWVPHHLLYCTQADVARESPVPADDPVAKLGGQGKPVNAGKRVFPIFGQAMFEQAPGVARFLGRGPRFCKWAGSSRLRLRAVRVPRAPGARPLPVPPAAFVRPRDRRTNGCQQRP
jgi:N-acetylmuramoyl-L-alanine amidase